MGRTVYTKQTTVPMRDCENGSSLPKCTLACTHGQSHSHTWPRGRRHGGERRDATKYSEFGTLFLSMRSLYGCDSASMHQHRVPSRCVCSRVCRLWGELAAFSPNVTYRKINIMNRRCCPAVKARNFIYSLESTTF